MREASLLFLKKKQQKNFCPLAHVGYNRHAPKGKIFWFFFSKKNTFLAQAAT
jgi:hypothetical protein